ncbi:MAG: hypothetical protein PHG85_03280 [Candidatus Altiarchaeota archaeon]|nr:hypothetical protein [Candidatus Altiarchaeota archaeon]
MQVERVRPDVLARLQQHLNTVAPVEPGHKAEQETRGREHRDLARKLPVPKAVHGPSGGGSHVRRLPLSGIQDAGQLEEALEDPNVVIVMTGREEEKFLQGLRGRGVVIDSLASLPGGKFHVLPTPDDRRHDRLA